MSDLYTSAATSKALAEAGLPQEGLERAWMWGGIRGIRAWRLDELLALLPAGWTLGHRWDPKFTPYYVARSTEFETTGSSPVEAVAALVLAVRGAGKGEEPRT